jgi:hypothetical protein
MAHPTTNTTTPTTTTTVAILSKANIFKIPYYQEPQFIPQYPLHLFSNAYPAVYNPNSKTCNNLRHASNLPAHTLDTTTPNA